MSLHKGSDAHIALDLILCCNFLSYLLDFDCNVFQFKMSQIDYVNNAIILQGEASFTLKTVTSIIQMNIFNVQSIVVGSKLIQLVRGYWIGDVYLFGYL